MAQNLELLEGLCNFTFIMMLWNGLSHLYKGDLKQKASQVPRVPRKLVVGFGDEKAILTSHAKQIKAC